MNRGFVFCIGLSVLIMLLFALNLVMGSIRIPVADVVGALTGDETVKASWRYIVLE